MQSEQLNLTVVTLTVDHLHLRCSLITIVFVVKWGGFIGKPTWAHPEEEFPSNEGSLTVGALTQVGPVPPLSTPS